MPIYDGYVARGTAAAADPYKALRMGTPTLAPRLYNLSYHRTPLISLAGLRDMTATDFRFPILATTRLKDRDMTSADTLNASVTTLRSERDSTIAPDPQNYDQSTTWNVVQIMQAAVSETYASESARSRLSLIGAAPNQPGIQGKVLHLAQQIDMSLIDMAVDMEVCALIGVYQEPTDGTVVGKTRGLLTMMKADGAANTIELSEDATGSEIHQGITALLSAMQMNGARFGNMCIMGHPLTIDLISNAYATNTPQPVFKLPADRFTAGWNVQQIMTKRGLLPLFENNFIPEGTAIILDMSEIGNVWLPNPETGLLGIQKLATIGAGTRYQIYGQWGFNHGIWNSHGVINFTAAGA